MPNYWILQANPGEYFMVDYFLDDYLRSHPSYRDYEEWWGVNRRDEQWFQRGDIVFVWKALKKPKKTTVPEYHEWKRLRKAHGYSWPRERGIYAVGEVSAPAASRAFNVPDDLRKYYVGDTWKKSVEPGYRILFSYTDNLVDAPLFDTKIFSANTPSLKQRFEGQGGGQGISSWPLPPDEGRLLLKLLGIEL